MSNDLRKQWGRPKYNAHGAAVKQQMRHASKIGMDWRTRKRGTSKQIGQKFPTGETKKLPEKIQTSALSSRAKLKKGHYSLAVTFKDGKTVVHRFKAEGEDAAIDKVDAFLHKFEHEKGKEIREVNLLTGGKEGEPLTSTVTPNPIAPPNPAPAAAPASAPVAEKKGILTGTSEPTIASKLVNALKPQNLEKTSETIGRWAGAPSRAKAAFQKGYSGYDPKEEERLKREIRIKTLNERLAREPGQRITKMMVLTPSGQLVPATENTYPSQTMGAGVLYGRTKDISFPEQKYYDMGPSLAPADSYIRVGPEIRRSAALNERIERAIKRNTAPRAFDCNARTRAAKVQKLQQLSAELASVNEAARQGLAPADKARLQQRLTAIEREAYMTGAKYRGRRHKTYFKTKSGKRVEFISGGKNLKYWIQKAIKKEHQGQLIAKVKRKYGSAGFEPGVTKYRKRIKMAILKKMAKEGGTTAKQAQLAMRLREFH